MASKINRKKQILGYKLKYLIFSLIIFVQLFNILDYC